MTANPTRTSPKARQKKLTEDELMQVGGHLAPDEMGSSHTGTFELLMELVENPPPAPPALRKLLRIRSP